MVAGGLGLADPDIGAYVTCRTASYPYQRTPLSTQDYEHPGRKCWILNRDLEDVGEPHHPVQRHLLWSIPRPPFR